MKEFKCEYKTPISYIKESPNEYVNLLDKFKEMKALTNMKIYSRIEDYNNRFIYQYIIRVWKLDYVGSIQTRSRNRYYKTLRYNAIYYTDILFQALHNKYRRHRRPISQYKRRIE